ncbi:hypothetical protein [Prosthecobacter sp.]|uniref:hypothetical protein n=1 Tax=Prosthecobacter sp. TaxID=1965333 RepID=UPI002AB96519|nr:hypothetical protein [Prosthecobacter sp.]MDZ4402192.1 hypothetical protein [Prosthecobacter sp.]
MKYVSLHEASGYGITARRNITGLVKHGAPVTWTPMMPGRRWWQGYEPFCGTLVGDPELDPVCNRRVDYDTVVVHTVPEFYPDWIRREPDKRILGCTVWETDVIPDHWKDLLNSVHGLIVPCQWNREVFEKCGVRVPVHVVPHLYDERPMPARMECHDIPQEDYVFYTIGEWAPRKTIWLTVRAFCEAFTADDKVTLVVKTNRHDHTQSFWRPFPRSTARALEQVLRDYPNPPRIKLLPEPLSDDDMLLLHARGDCYVSLCRSEGWGMGAFDAARFGKPVIMTGYGGQLDFLPPDLARLIRYRLIPAEAGARWRSYTRDQQWADPDVSHASQEMRRAYESPDVAAEQGRKLREFVLSRFQNSRSMEKLVAILRGEG